MVKHANLILTNYGSHGWGVTSPDLPELVGGRETLQELRKDLRDIAEFAGLEHDGAISKHIQKPFEFDGKLYFIRAAEDALFEVREATSSRAFADIRSHQQTRDYLQADEYGDISIIAASLDDTMDYATASIWVEQPTVLAVTLLNGCNAYANILHTHDLSKRDERDLDIRSDEEYSRLRVRDLFARLHPAPKSGVMDPSALYGDSSFLKATEDTELNSFTAPRLVLV